MANDDARIHAYVKGYVQGVGFRFYVLQHGTNLNLHGWVRNRFNGQVEVVAEGPKDLLEGLLDRLKEGPPASQVDEVLVDWYPASGDLPTPFTVKASE
jgi:acylphosphatase